MDTEIRSSFGFPRMHKEAGERRDFLPCLLTFLDHAGAGEIVLEEGYGAGIDIPPSAYLEASPRVHFGSYEETLTQDIVTVLRCPDPSAIERMRPGSTLVSMFHFPTRPERVGLLTDLGVHGVSLDAITDDLGRRLVENIEATAWNGIREAFRELRRLYRLFELPGRRPLRVTVLGAGAVGAHAVRAATRYGDVVFREAMVAGGVPGVEVTVVDFDLTWNEPYMLSRLELSDILVDATQRPDQSRVVVPNPWIAALPIHAVILDLSADPYDLDANPRRVKGIEGVPEGDLDAWLFHPDHPAYARLDRRVDSSNRRMALSCNAWPGLRPRECMEVYSGQIQPVLRAMLETPIERLDAIEGRLYERAVARAEVTRWIDEVRAG